MNMAVLLLVLGSGEALGSLHPLHPLTDPAGRYLTLMQEPFSSSRPGPQFRGLVGTAPGWPRQTRTAGHFVPYRQGSSEV